MTIHNLTFENSLHLLIKKIIFRVFLRKVFAVLHAEKDQIDNELSENFLRNKLRSQFQLILFSNHRLPVTPAKK